MRLLLKKAFQWKPKNDSDLEHDKNVFLDYMRENCCGKNNARSIDFILDEIRPLLRKQDYKRGGFQQSIVVPFKEEKEFYIGTEATVGIYLVVDEEDVVGTLNFYRNRIRSEHKHLRNLKAIAKKYKLLKNLTNKSNNKAKKRIFFDESGTPVVNDREPYFIVGALVINGEDIKKINELFIAINNKLGYPPEGELSSTRIDFHNYKFIFNKLAKIDYEFAAICFVKKYLTTKGYQYPKSFYKQAYQFLVGDILDYVGEASLHFDEYGTKGARFEKEFFNYLERENFGFALNKIKKISSEVSEQNKPIQFVDLLIGAIKHKLKRKFDVTPWFEEKVISVQYFPHL